MPDLNSALRRATVAMYAAGFWPTPDPKNSGFSSAWYELSPALPNSWPPRDCKLVFYVFHITPHRRFKYDTVAVESANWRIEVDLRSGEVVASGNSGPWPRGGDYFGGWKLYDTWQNQMFKAVDYSRIPAEPFPAFTRYIDWLEMADPAFVVWLSHAEFFDWVTRDLPDLRKSIGARAREIMSGRAKFAKRPAKRRPRRGSRER